MATPMTAAQLRAALKKWKVPYVEEVRDGVSWFNHNRNSRGASGPVNGFLIHHTGDDAPDSADLRVLWYGRSDLSGPLCHFALDDEGVQHLVGLGRTNHAGGGDPAVLNAVISESYGAYPPATRKHQGTAGAVDGNARFYGQETMYSGKNRMTAAAYKSTILTAAAICDFHGWSEKSVIGHKEWSDYKVDPGSLDMAVLRAEVKAVLKGGPTYWTSSTSAAKPPVVPKPVVTPVATAPKPPRGGSSVILTVRDETGQKTYLYGFSAPPVLLPGAGRPLLASFTRAGVGVAETTPAMIELLTDLHTNEQIKLAAVTRPLSK